MSWTVAIGVDTHKDEHVAVACDRVGAQLDSRAFEATEAGFAGLLVWAQRLGRPAFAVEGCGSYGARLACFLSAAGCVVWECERPGRRERRRGKNDLIDATLAAQKLVSGQGLSRPRGGGRAREQLRLLLVERRGLVQIRTATINQLHAAALSPALPQRLQALNGEQLVRASLRLAPASIEQAIMRRVARRIRRLEREIAELEQQLHDRVNAIAPHLLQECGVGTICAAQLIVSSGDPTRMRNEAAFAALAGTSPVDASSGRQHRHRLNRGGDRQLNSALHTIALSRIRHHEQTRAYHQRLLERGKTKREAQRCIKRALARHFYHQLQTPPLTT